MKEQHLEVKSTVWKILDKVNIKFWMIVQFEENLAGGGHFHFHFHFVCVFEDLRTLRTNFERTTQIQVKYKIWKLLDKIKSNIGRLLNLRGACYTCFLVCMCLRGLADFKYQATKPDKTKGKLNKFNWRVNWAKLGTKAPDVDKNALYVVYIEIYSYKNTPSL